MRRLAARTADGFLMATDGPEPLIASTGNRRIVELRKLRLRKYRQEKGLFLAEGLQLLHMALDSAAKPITALYCREQIVGREGEILLQRFRQRGAELIGVAPQVMQTLSERDDPQGLVAAFQIPQVTLASLRLPQAALVVVLDRLQDPGNLGTLIRTADAAGAAALLLVEPCVDPYDPKTVRGSMGSLFNLPIVSVTDVSGAFAWLKAHGLRPVGADPHRGTMWGAGLWRGGTALVLGNEARGLSDDVAGHISDWACLPIVGKAESLNVAVAGGILMYARLREVF